VKIRSHSESHLVELDDGSKWKIFPGDLDITLHWGPDTDARLKEISSHALVSVADSARVRVIPATKEWPVREVKSAQRGVTRASGSGSTETGLILPTDATIWSLRRFHTASSNL
jgi:hypothetical protein